MSAHTPGPWRVEEDPIELKAIVWGRGRKRGQHRQHVANVWSGQEASLEVAMANARLIAAAPALLEALEALVKHNDALCAQSGQFSTADPMGYQRNEQARAAIRAAKGEA